MAWTIRRHSGGSLPWWNFWCGGEDAEAPSSRAGFSAAQFVRLGSADGLHVSVLNNFILFEDEFVFGGITVDGAFPIRLFNDPAWIVASGGGGTRAAGQLQRLLRRLGSTSRKPPARSRSGSRIDVQ